MLGIVKFLSQHADEATIGKAGVDVGSEFSAVMVLVVLVVLI